jgi:NADH:ubiquinone oxidoreductase subunit 6 (subunit J)
MLNIIAMQSGSWLAANAFVALLVLLFIGSALAVALPLFLAIFFGSRGKGKRTEGETVVLLLLGIWVLFGALAAVYVWVIPVVSPPSVPSNNIHD